MPQFQTKKLIKSRSATHPHSQIASINVQFKHWYQTQFNIVTFWCSTS